MYCQAAWFDVQSGSGGLKCVFSGAEGILTVDAEKATVMIKVQGRDPVGLRGLLSGCLRSTIDSFDGVEVTNENIVCGSKKCNVWRSTKGLRQRIMQGRLIFHCENCVIEYASRFLRIIILLF